MGLNVINQRTIKGIVISTVSFSFLGGALIGTGIEQMVFKRSAYNWAGNVLAGFALFVCGVCWAAMLLRRVRAELPK
jgi:hypothetical protein